MLCRKQGIKSIFVPPFFLLDQFLWGLDCSGLMQPLA